MTHVMHHLRSTLSQYAKDNADTYYPESLVIPLPSGTFTNDPETGNLIQDVVDTIVKVRMKMIIAKNNPARSLFPNGTDEGIYYYVFYSPLNTIRFEDLPWGAEIDKEIQGRPGMFRFESKLSPGTEAPEKDYGKKFYGRWRSKPR